MRQLKKFICAQKYNKIIQLIASKTSWKSIDCKSLCKYHLQIYFVWCVSTSLLSIKNRVSEGKEGRKWFSSKINSESRKITLNCPYITHEWLYLNFRIKIWRRRDEKHFCVTNTGFLLTFANPLKSWPSQMLSIRKEVLSRSLSRSLWLFNAISRLVRLKDHSSSS